MANFGNNRIGSRFSVISNLDGNINHFNEPPTGSFRFGNKEKFKISEGNAEQFAGTFNGK